MTNYLITGLPGVGKTTVIRKLIQSLEPYKPAGFYTDEIRVGGARKGFKLRSLDGREQILSHVQHRSGFKVGRYGVDVGGFEHLLVELALSRSASQVIIIDEIGKMECLSGRFQALVTELLDSTKTLVATIAMKGNGFIQGVRQRPDCCMTTVTGQNRDGLADALTAQIVKSLKASP